MKRLLFIFCVIFSSISFSQEVKTQKTILDIPNTDLIQDFNLKIGNGNIIPEEVSIATYKDIGFSFIGHKFQYMKDDYSINTHTFKNKKLLQTITTYNYGTYMKSQGFNFKYTYDSNGNLSKRTSTSSGSNYTDQTFYTYSNNRIKQVRETGTYDDGKQFNKTRNFIYNGNTISYDFENGTKDYELKNKLITLEKTFNKSANKNYINTYKYNANGFLIIEDRGSYQATYTLNRENQIEKVINKSYTKTFKYVYDKYGNWIIAYPLSTYNKNLYGSQFSYYIRQLKYSNDEVTGSINPDDNTTKTNIIKLRSELYNNLVIPSVTFSKTSDESYLFKIDDQQEAKNTTSVFMGRSLLVFHKPTNKLYILESFEDKPIGKDFPVKEVSIDLKNGFWYKTEKGGVHVFRKDGSYIKEVKVWEFATNNIDAIFQGEKEHQKVVLENYKNVQTNKPYSITLYSNYNKGGLSGVSKNAERLANSLEKYSDYFVGKCIKGDCKNGYGEKEFQDGKRAEGFFKDGQPNGPMHTSDKNNNKSLFGNYKGSFQAKEGFTYEFDGKNLSIFSDKSKNTGFYNDYKTKKTYILYFNNGKVTSKKELSYNNSKTCVVGNCYNGVGIYVYDNGATYMGTFTNGKRNGYGTLYHKNGDQYIGEFYNGNYNGLGTYIWSGSEYTYYLGNYNNGKYHGKGVRYYSKDKFDAGNWTNGKLDNQTTTSNSNNSSTNINASNSIANTNSNSTGFNIFSLEQKNKILACKSDSDCTADYISSLNYENGTKLSGQTLVKKITDYFQSLHTMNPELAYNTLFKIHYSLLDIKSLPEDVQQDLRHRAKGLAEGYKKFKKENGN